jgi:hypothetical protein
MWPGAGSGCTNGGRRMTIIARAKAMALDARLTAEELKQWERDADFAGV